MNQVVLLLFTQIQAKARIIVVHDIIQCGKPPIVEESTFLMGKTNLPAARYGSDGPERGRLESYDTDLGSGMHIPSWFRPKRFDMAPIASCLAADGGDAGTEAEALEVAKAAVEFGIDPNAVHASGETAIYGRLTNICRRSRNILRRTMLASNNNSGWTRLRIATGVHRRAKFRISPPL